MVVETSLLSFKLENNPDPNKCHITFTDFYFSETITYEFLQTLFLEPITEQDRSTPFENPQRWMGQNTFPILLLNDDNMIKEH